MHDKYVIVDDYGYILGGRNTFDYFIGSYPTDSRSHDREVLVYNTAHGTDRGKDSSLYQVEDYFEQVWNLDVSSLFHDSEKTGDRTSVRNAAAMLRERYKVLAIQYPDLFDSEGGFCRLHRRARPARLSGPAHGFKHQRLRLPRRPGYPGRPGYRSPPVPGLIPDRQSVKGPGVLRFQHGSHGENHPGVQPHRHLRKGTCGLSHHVCSYEGRKKECADPHSLCCIQ